MIRISELRLDYLKQPVGVTKLPQFGWMIDSDQRNIIQTAYQLQIADNPDFNNAIYDSGLVESEDSAHVIPDKPALKSASKYFVHVRIKSNTGEISKWSDSTYFVTALISNIEWRAAFISAETKEDASNSKGTYLRTEFTVKNKVKEAYAFTTALGLYKFYINGKKVGTDEMTPGWTSYNKRLLYQTYDITDLLNTGKNAAGALVGAGWYKGTMGFIGARNNYGDQTAFLSQIHIRYEDGTTDIIGSDETWKGSDSPVLFSEIYDGEIYDARLEQPGWNTPGFEDKDWKAVSIVDFNKEILTAQSGTRVKKVEEVSAKRIFTTPKGDTVIDFGQNMTGWIHFRVNGKAGDKVILNCFEVLDSEGNVYFDNLRKAKETLDFTCKGGEEEYEPNFTFQGFQFAKIAAYPGNTELSDFTAYAVHSDMEPTGTFDCSNQDINQLQHNILWGLKGNFLDIPTDCPQRNERLGWTGDAQIFCRTASYLMNTYTFFHKWLKDVAADQTPEGGVPHVVPDLLSGKEADDWLLSQGTHSAAAWADVAVINPWTLYLTFGDKEIIKEQYESMKAWINFMQTHSVDNIWNYKLQFGDWVALDAEEGSYFGATPNDLTCTAYYAYSTGLFARMANYIGNTKDYETYRALFEQIKKAFQEHFFDEDGNMTANTQTAHVVALYFNLVPEKYRQKTAEALVRLVEKENGHLVTGFVGTPYICHALSQNGHIKEAYDLLLKDDFPSWLYQVKKGATTVWEHWDGLKPDGTMWSPDMNSFNHYAYGAIGEWLYRVVAGIEIDETNPGYKHSIIHPRFGGGLSYVNAGYKSVYGNLSVHWEQKDDKCILEVTVPHNTSATILLDGAKDVLQADGLQFEKAQNDRKALTGSGTYHIEFVR
ncbi:family 78 glycoside hydrolase catalytic domain [Anaerocolumna sedimenticola]|uniref:alpha-L-rhamnosidase n=1 Tax=Anaerocolumna sedimenticola TaxID=2696063 RepID=A0A6P1TIT6_9FIRM|nr:alpha-L-rhamnosidase [Anaerocolumna sedimenticola]QHQ60333.1 family 78 glycoside hydrolase catalytic domain [Anaerocolumna sedimenticola]